MLQLALFDLVPISCSAGETGDPMCPGTALPNEGLSDRRDANPPSAGSPDPRSRTVRPSAPGSIGGGGCSSDPGGSPLVELVPTGPLDVNCYIVGCPETGKAFVIDPGGHGKRILRRLEQLGLTAVLVIDTHGHFDHIGGNAALIAGTGATLALHREDLFLLREAKEHADHWNMPFEASPEPSWLLVGGEVLEAGTLRLRVLHTPGHSPGGISLSMPGHVFTGDALFPGSVGRTDLPGGDLRTLIASIRSQLLTLPDETVVHPGHEGETTIGRERLENPFLR